MFPGKDQPRALTPGSISSSKRYKRTLCRIVAVGNFNDDETDCEVHNYDDDDGR